MAETPVVFTDGSDQRPIVEEPHIYEDYMTLGQTAQMLDLFGRHTPEDIDAAGPLCRPSPLLGRLIVQHGIETVIVPRGDGRLTRALSPYAVNCLFDLIHPKE